MSASRGRCQDVTAHVGAGQPLPFPAGSRTSASPCRARRDRVCLLLESPDRTVLERLVGERRYGGCTCLDATTGA